MDDERQQIMEMLAAGTISAEETYQLFEAIEVEPPASTGETQRIEPSRPADTPRQTADSFANLTLDQLIQMRIHGVDPEFIREVRETGR